jgi:hypothetical protein
MAWRQDAEEMRRLLKDAVVPSLRALGFKGSFPHFTRAHPTRLDLLSFQFSQFGPDLYIEVASCGPDGYTTPDGLLVPKGRVRTYHVSHHRARIGPLPALSFEGIAETKDAARLAAVVSEAIELQGEAWWKAPTSLTT